MPKSEKFQQLPAPWDRIFALVTRLFVWGLLITTLYILRPFFLLIFLTFVFAYIQSHAVEGLAHRFSNRVYRALIIFLIFLGVIIGTLYFLAPHVRNQMGEFTANYESYMTRADTSIYKWIDDNPGVKKILEGDPKKPDGDDPKIDGNKKKQVPVKPEDRPAVRVEVVRAVRAGLPADVERAGRRDDEPPDRPQRDPVGKRPCSVQARLDVSG